MVLALLKYYHKIIRSRRNPEFLNATANDHVHETGKKLYEIKVDELKSEIDAAAEDLKEFSSNLFAGLARIMEISQGAFFLVDKKKGSSVIRYISGYANHNPGAENLEYEFGQGLPGQVAKDKKLLNIDSVPEGYITILSGLGESSPKSLIIFPVLDNNDVLAVIELASFRKFSESDEEILIGITPVIAEKVIKLRKKYLHG